MARSVFGIFVPASVLAGESINQNVGPSVLVKVIRKSEKILGVGIVFSETSLEAFNIYFGAILFLGLKYCIGRRVFVAFFKIRALIPKRTDNHIHNPIMVKVAEVGAFSPEFIRKLDFLEGVKGFRMQQGDGSREDATDEKWSVHAICWTGEALLVKTLKPAFAD